MVSHHFILVGVTVDRIPGHKVGVHAQLDARLSQDTIIVNKLNLMLILKSMKCPQVMKRPVLNKRWTLFYLATVLLC